ncbi:MetS family NSS transporter small subunit [Tepidibacillus infernus]|nr:MetS family NSS transporter small subunit [Tepidibacillus sp. HK-1]GBF10259.1 hypothetical protein HK1_00271 [Tepidibacillus sp. HK-1]
MSTGAIFMFIFGATLLWGGLGVALSVAISKSKKASNQTGKNAVSHQ